MTILREEILEFCSTTTNRIGQGLLEKYGQVTAERKPDGSLVTSADHWADAEIREAIAQTFPHHGILTEELAHLYKGEEWCWVIDPIDGTTNYTHGIPIWGISLGLLYQGIPVFGHVDFPMIKESFHGYWYGQNQENYPTNFPSPGAFVNHQPITTSSDLPSLNHCFSLCARSTKILAKPNFPCKIRLIGVASYNCLMVAKGTTLGTIEATPKVWDIAAVWPIVQAAGGAWVSLDTLPFPLEVGQDYGNLSFPSLVVSQPKLIEVFSGFLS